MRDDCICKRVRAGDCYRERYGLDLRELLDGEGDVDDDTWCACCCHGDDEREETP